MHNFKNIYINNWFSVVGPLEKNSNLKNFDLSMSDYYFGEDTFEHAELKMQKMVLNYLLRLNKPNLIIGSDLLDQSIISNMNLINRAIPYLGIYSACASSVAGIITMANYIQSKNIKEGIYITSSHNLTAEKQFRFPIEYGAPKPKRSTFTATGCIGMVISNKESNIKVINGTLGTVIDSYVKDAHNMGAVMAPSAVNTLLMHLEKTKTTVNDYDLILTGDLGIYGRNILIEYMKEEYKLDITDNYNDCGVMLYDLNKQEEVQAGGSGPVCSALVNYSFIVDKLKNKELKKVLLVATGALFSPTFIFQGQNILSIAHAVSLEAI